MGSPTKLAHAMFWWGEAKAGVAFMPPRGIRCDRLAARAVRHCLALPSEGTRPQGRGVPKYKKNPTFASIAGFFFNISFFIIELPFPPVYFRLVQAEINRHGIFNANRFAFLPSGNPIGHRLDDTYRLAIK